MMTTEYWEAKERNWRYECYCPHCGNYKKHIVMDKDTNGYNWGVLQIECADCGLYHEMWVDKDELKQFENKEE